VLEGRRERSRAVRLHAFGVEHLIRASIAHPRATIAAWILITIVSALGATRVEFNDDAARLRPAGTPAVSAQLRAGEVFGRNANVGLLVATGRTADEAIVRSRGLMPLMERLTREKRIEGFDTIAGALPSTAEQQRALDTLRSFPPPAFDPERVARSIA